jgi:hypothetical protein
LKESDILNESRPVLVQLALSNNQLDQPKLLEAEFEINPLDRDAGYRIQVISQSLEIKYNAVNIYIKLNND